MNTDKSAASRREEMQHYGFGTQAMQQIKVCEACGAMGAANQQFCRDCGAKLPQHTLYDTYRQNSLVCPYCGAVVPHTAAYCPKCGKKLELESGGKENGTF